MVYYNGKKFLFFSGKLTVQEFEDAKVKEFNQLKEEIEENSKIFFLYEFSNV